MQLEYAKNKKNTVLYKFKAQYSYNGFKGGKFGANNLYPVKYSGIGSSQKRNNGTRN